MWRPSYKSSLISKDFYSLSSEFLISEAQFRVSEPWTSYSMCVRVRVRACVYVLCTFGVCTSLKHSVCVYSICTCGRKIGEKEDMTPQVVSEAATHQNISCKSLSEPRNESSEIEFTPVDGQFTCVAPFLPFPPSLSPSPLSIHLPLFLACNPETHHAEQAGPIGCISPLQLPKIRQANAGAPRGEASCW